MSGGGVKYDNGKPQMGLIPPRALVDVAEVYTMGANKYAAHNWTKGMKWSRVYDAVQRHLNAFWAGENLDQESQLCHLAHAAWGCLTLLEFRRLHPELDDRYDYFKEAQQNCAQFTKPVAANDSDPDGKDTQVQGHQPCSHPV